MALLDISEYLPTLNTVSNFSLPVAQEPAVSNQQIAVSGVSAQSVNFGARTTLVRLHSDVACRYQIGVSPAATATSPRLSPGISEYFAVQAGHKLAVISTT